VVAGRQTKPAVIRHFAEAFFRFLGTRVFQQAMSACAAVEKEARTRQGDFGRSGK
jgi:hypothetical protein